MTRYTQSDIAAIFGGPSTRRKPLEKIAYHGTYNGFPIVYSREYTGEGTDIPTVDDFVQATAWLGTLGITAPANLPAGQLTTPAMQAPPTPQGYQPAPPPQPQVGWSCPFHGVQKLGPGKGGVGVECAVTTKTPPQYPSRQWTGRSGDIMYTCAAKSA